MTYAEIIQSNCQKVTPSWWPKYAYHFSDVTNIVNILASGMLYSRVRANQFGLMKNDNASSQVISMTETKAKAYVRFYFRPLTPTQYNNEGYKHAKLRYYGDENANVPVPVFLVFDLAKVLTTNGVCFSELTQAGGGSRLMQGTDAFANLPFEKIYSDGPCVKEIWQYRHAEILCPDSFSINDSLRMILCRNECEKATLLNLLKDTNQTAFYRYKDFVRVANAHTFNRNGFFVDSVVINEDEICFEFAQTYEKRLFERNKANQPLEKIKASFQFEWLNRRSTVLYTVTSEVMIDYINERRVMFSSIPSLQGSYRVRITMRIDNNIICVANHLLEQAEII